MEDCIFCKIVKQEIPCADVYADDKILAFLDIGPIAVGHTLIIPRRHYPSLWEIPGDLAKDLLLAMQKVGRAMMEVTRATGMNVVMNNFGSAGQVVPHAHWHLIPRVEGDGLFQVAQKEYESREAMHDLARSMKQALG
ncbi:MAG: HIT family protein [Desulfohalobiaceae bacterium]|nr:HIT family protein [Desulfohalobiaceae bacterium]